jgi:hypothetical protein
MSRYLLGATIALLATTIAFAEQATTMKKSLYDRIGGEAALTKVVDDFVAKAAANPKVNFTRNGTWALSAARRSTPDDP